MMKPVVRTAFILGAGLGTRLRPLTDACPKPLLPVGGRPLVTYAMDHCLSVGIRRFIVNTHHCATAYERAFPDRNWRGWPVLFRHEPVLLETAGGLKNIEDLLDPDGALLIYNGDILSDLPLEKLLEAHAASGREVTLVLRSQGGVMNVSLDAEGRVCDLRGLLGNPGVRRCCFTGIYAAEKAFLGRLTPGKVESVVPVFVRMIAAEPGSVGAVLIDEGRWEDIGSLEAYERIRPGVSGLRYMGEGDGRVRSSPSGEPASVPSGNGEGQADAVAFVSRILGPLREGAFALAPVGRGGSDRDYFRVTIAGSGRTSWVLMRYNRIREENNYYAGIAAFLRRIGVRVPAILGHDPGRGLLLMEDLGDLDLFALRDAPWELRRGFYEKTLALAARLHGFPRKDFPVEDVPLMPGFGPELYRWERGYFREQCVGKLCRIPLEGEEERCLEAELSGLADRLLEMPLSLVHRDFQSQNVIVLKGEPVLIDFQGMRFGSPFYDLGSLLWDPYVEIPMEGRQALLHDYYDLSGSPQTWEAFRECFLLASAQRLMQALGAYGFLGIEKGKTHFLAHVPSALGNLVSVTREAGSLSNLHALACRCCEALAERRSGPSAGRRRGPGPC